MAATAHAAPSLEISAPDAMDLHSESGLDFGDADIELDLESDNHAQRLDDDVSINDAATDTGADIQSVVVDHDDYMVDKEDVIDEDDIQYEDGPLTNPTMQNDTTEGHEEPPTAPDEDLIDYLDEEEQQFDDDHAEDLAENDNDTIDMQQIGSPEHQSTMLQKTDVYGFGGEDDAEAQDQHDVYDLEHTIVKEESIHTKMLEIDDDVDAQSDDNEGGVPLQEPEVHHNEDDEDDDSHGEQDRPAESRPITINYEGNELWLLKEHDTEDSGDWLLEDKASISSSLADLLKACRSALGEDISPETELGLRFDHLHDMELFEDNTACVAVSLERLINLYYTLHTQDGNNDPESFYMSLLSRPRFAALLSDVAKHAEDGSGYSGLAAAVAAGETHFPDNTSGHSTEHENTEWDEDEEADNHEDTQSPSDSEHVENSATPADPSEVREHDDQEADEEEKEEEEEEAEGDEKAYDTYTHTEHVPPQDVESPSQANANTSKAASQEPDSTDDDAQVESQAAEDARKEQEAQDTVNYSDDDGGDDDQHSPTNAPSPSSSTVQGDESAIGDDARSQVAHQEYDPNVSYNSALVDDKDSRFVEEVDTHTSGYEKFDEDFAAESYEGYDQAYDQAEQIQGVPVSAEEIQTNEPDFDTYTNEELVEYDYQNMDQQLQDEFLSSTAYDGHVAPITANDTSNADEFLDFNNPPEWATDETVNSHMPDDTLFSHEGEYAARGEEEEDGEVEHRTVTSSPAAEPLAATLLGSKDMSPQGLKRSIDEVGDAVDETPDFTDNKRPRV